MLRDEEMAEEVWMRYGHHQRPLIRFTETSDSFQILYLSSSMHMEAEAAIAAQNRWTGMSADQNRWRGVLPLRLASSLWHHGLGQDAQMWRSMTNTSLSTLRNHGLSSGHHHHHPGYAAAPTASSGVNGVNRVLNPLTTAGGGTGTAGLFFPSVGNFTGAPGLHAEMEGFHRPWRDAVVAQRPTDSDLEAGGAGAAPTQQPSEEVDRMLKDFICQLYAALQPACALAYPALKGAPDHVKLITFGGLGVINIVLFAGMVSRSSARRRLAFRLVSCSSVTLLTFSVASQLSGPTYIATTAVVGVLLSLVIMLLRF